MERPSVSAAVKEGWRYLFVFGLLIFMMVHLRQDTLAPFYATALLLVINQFLKKHRFTLSSGVMSGTFDALSGSVVDISGGVVGRYLQAVGGSEVNISGGELRQGVLILNQSELVFSGGLIGSSLEISDGSRADVSPLLLLAYLLGLGLAHHLTVVLTIPSLALLLLLPGGARQRGLMRPRVLAAAATLPIALLFVPHRGGSVLVAFTVALAAFVFWAHRSNIRRLLKGEENRFGTKKGGEEG